MAYVFWRVFMKKYSKVRLGIHRSPIPITPALPAPVTPTGRHVRGFEEESWKPSDDTASSVQQGGSSTGVITSQPKSDPNKQPAAGADDLSRNNEVRKSKTTRVKNYLKKCKNVALSAATGGRKDDKTAHNDTQSQPQDAAGKSSWYVPPANSTEETSQKRVVEIDVTENVMTIVTIDGVEETNDCVVGGVEVVESGDDVLLNTIGDENCSAISTFSLERTDIDFSEKFISDNNSVFEISEISVDNTDSGYQPYHRPQVSSPDLTEAQVQVEDSIYCDSAVASDSSHPVISENVSEVASLVDRLLGPLYVNFSRTRPLLVRQARDLLVCEYLGNLARFEREFCVPASQLLQTVKDQADGKKNGSANDQTGSSNSNNISATSPIGWPLSLGLSGVSLHLGPLAPALLRHRDCYLCVRTRSSPGLEVALVWRYHHTISSRILAEYKYPCEDAPIISCSGFESITTLEMAALDNPDAIVLTKQEDGKVEDDLPELLENLLVSVERAIERIPLDDLTFPCPQCHQYLPLFERTDDKDVNAVNSCLSCQCSCQTQDNVVQKKDTSIQTSPMFEFASSIPHIDSDEDDDGKISGKLSSGGLQKQLPEIAIPKSITDLPEKLLMSGINLPGTHDTDGRALILCDAACIARAGLSKQQVATLLLFYSTLSSKEKIDKVFSVLVLAETSEEVALDVLDKAMLLVTPRMKIERFIIWRPSSDSKKVRTPKNLKYSKITCYIVCDETALESYISKPDAPACCGGSCSHDQLEWVEFYRELEPFTRQCLLAGQALASTMAEIRTDDTSAQSQITRRLLNHQQRQMSRALSNSDVQKIRRDGPSSLERLEERAQWLTGSADVRAARDHARRYIGEVQRVARRIEQLAEQRRDRLKELARLRAVEEQTSEVLQWIREVGEEKLKTHSSLCRSAADQETVRQQEQDFEKFYFIAMRYIDKAGDLLEEANQCSDPRANNLKILSQSLKLQIRVFGESLEETRESLEDVSRYFQLMERINGSSSPEAPVEETCSEMMKLAMKLGNEKLIEKSRELKQIECPSPPLPTDQPVTSTPIQQQSHNLPGRRQSVSSFAYIYKCNHHAAGFPCNCWDSDEGTISQKLKNHYVQSLQQQQKCGCNVISTVNKDNKLISLGDIKEVRESAENLLDCNNDDSDNKFRDDKNDSGVSGCGKCDEHSVVIRRNVAFKRKNHPRMTAHQRMAQSCQCYSEACTVCSAADTSSASGSNGDHTEHQGDITEGGSDGFPKSSGSDELEESDEQYRSKTLPPVQVNSHLHCHASSLHLPTETASAHLMDPKTYKTLLLIMREMIQTERDYVKSLDYIIENYIPELMREDIPQALRGQRNVVFGNVEKIYEFHSQHFLRELENCAENPLLVGQSFLRHEKKFYLYALYNKNKPKSDSLMSEYGTVFFKSKQLELKDKMDLASYLLKPVQRMGKYALLLQQLMKACSPIPAGTPERETAEMEDLKLAEQMVRFQLRHGNDLLAMDSLRDCDVNLKEQGRLLRQNEFLVWEGRGGKKSLRQVFLFEELILFSKARRFPDRKNLDLYIYKNSIKMTDIGLTARIGDSSTKFEIWFRKRKPNDTFTLQSMSEDVKKAWTEEISQLLWKQAMRNREVRLQEMSSMGIGNKPCLDIRPSADQINDRSISIAQLSKTAPRFRNSIAGPIIETCRTNKRPQSIISVSSLSSGSTSSAGSGMTVGRHHNPQAIGYDTPVSPKTHHRSTTLNSQCSMESGIIADISLGSDDCTDSGTGSHWPLQKSNSLHSNASSKSNTVISSNPQSPDEPQVTLYHVPDELSINL